MRFLVAFVVLFAACEALSFFDVVASEWEEWKSTHKKSYNSTDEDRFRMKVYMENRARIARHNHKASKGKHTYYLKMNHYGDMLHHEFVTTHNGYKMSLRSSSNLLGSTPGSTFIAPEHIELPTAMDWRNKGAVTPVKNQGQCGSCWAFSTTGSLEGQHFRKTGKLVSLSEQQLVDCSQSFGNNGCNGGLMDNAFKYIKANGGIDTESGYPYDGEDEPCHFKKSEIGADDTGFVDIPQGDEAALAKAVGSIGPVSVAIDAAHESFQFYSHGVYNEPECDPTQLDHGVLVVGYGTDPEGGDFWLVKNSWGTSWGDQGYIKMTRGKNNQCGIASAASYPLV